MAFYGTQDDKASLAQLQKRVAATRGPAGFHALDKLQQAPRFDAMTPGSISQFSS